MACQCTRGHTVLFSGAPVRPKLRRGTQITHCSDAAAQIEKQLFGEDLGARDPTVGEIESNFSEKTLWNWDTNHLIKAPDSIGSLIGIAAKACSEVPATAVDEKQRELLRAQVPGWRVESSESGPTIRRDWSAQGADQAQDIKLRLEAVAAHEKHPVHVNCVDTQVFAVLPASTSEASLSERDFVLAAKFNAVDLADLELKKRARFWA